MKYNSIPYMLIRGGSSKGVYLNKKDLPIDEKKRNEIILSIVGRDKKQIDGLGGANPLTSKVAIVSKSKKINCDVDYLFIQVLVGENKVDSTPNCGNILSGVGIFAIESAIVKVNDEITKVKVNMINTNSICELIMQTPNKQITYLGDAKIDGVEGTSAPIICNYINIAGSVCKSLFPTGNKKDLINNIEITCIDNGMPVVLINAVDLNISGYETCEELNSNIDLKEKIELIRLKAGCKMNLGDVSKKVIPKISIISKSKNGFDINTRTFIPFVCHSSIGVLGAVSVASACLFEDCITSKISNTKKDLKQTILVEHPSGKFSVELKSKKNNNELEIKEAGLLRTARLISKGEVYFYEDL